jgi:hypothetical protein
MVKQRGTFCAQSLTRRGTPEIPARLSKPLDFRAKNAAADIKDTENSFRGRVPQEDLLVKGAYFCEIGDSANGQRQAHAYLMNVSCQTSMNFAQGMISG